MAEITFEVGSIVPEQRSNLYWAVSDSLTMIRRSLRHSTRNLDSLLLVVILPVALLLLFVYVFGGAINTGGTEYVNYVVPGIILLCAGYGSSMTAVSVSTDMVGGLIDRFRSLPILSSSVLTGHVVASLVRNMISTILVIAVALLIGFRPTADLMAWLAILGLLMLFILTLSWVSVIFGLLARSVEGASAYTFFILFLPYISSAFVPTQTMPNVLRFFAENQPITHVIETLRALTIGTAIGNHSWLAVAWCVGLLVIAYAIAGELFKRKTTR